MDSIQNPAGAAAPAKTADGRRPHSRDSLQLHFVLGPRDRDPASGRKGLAASDRAARRAPHGPKLAHCSTRCWATSGSCTATRICRKTFWKTSSAESSFSKRSSTASRKSTSAATRSIPKRDAKVVQLISMAYKGRAQVRNELRAHQGAALAHPQGAQALHARRQHPL